MNTKDQYLREVKELAKRRGGKCLSKEYVNSTTKMKFVCVQNHHFQSCRSYIKAGNWCPYCAGRGKTIEYLRSLAKDKNGYCLSDKYLGMHKKHIWKCEKGHIWEATPNNIKSLGRWCPTCGRQQSAQNRRRYTIDDMHKLATKKGGYCLSRSFKIVTEKLKWKCAKGHIWFADPHHILNGTWCPECAKKNESKKENKV